jgi:FixJ family two-component response regulator
MLLKNAIVHIVDDDESVRDGLKWLLESIGFKILEYARAEEFLAAYEPNPPECLLLDVRMPGMSGIELQKTINGKEIALPIIILTGHGDIQMAVQAMKKGAVDFIQKPYNQDVLIDLVKGALQKSSDDMRRTLEEVEREDRLAHLTARERQVLDLVVVGETNKAIASKLDISPKTVETHRARIMEKLCARSLADLISKAGIST